MTEDWQRFGAILLLAVLGGGILSLMGMTILNDGKVTAQDMGWFAAALLAIRDIVSKMEKIALGIRTPERPTEAIGDDGRV